MVKGNRVASTDRATESACCRIEALVSVDERGQMVLPKEMRDKLGIKAGDKLAISSWEREGKVCCLMIIKADELIGMVKDILGPVAKEIIK